CRGARALLSTRARWAAPVRMGWREAAGRFCPRARLPAARSLSTTRVMRATPVRPAAEREPKRRELTGRAVGQRLARPWVARALSWGPRGPAPAAAATRAAAALRPGWPAHPLPSRVGEAREEGP